MLLLFSHLRSRRGVVLDDQGSSFASIDEAVLSCRRAAREMIGADLQQGCIDLRQCIMITGRDGKVIREVPFADALVFKHADDAELGKLCLALLLAGEPSNDLLCPQTSREMDPNPLTGAARV